MPPTVSLQSGAVFTFFICCFPALHHLELLSHKILVRLAGTVLVCVPASERQSYKPSCHC